jgi:hypothetical protein
MTNILSDYECDRYLCDNVDNVKEKLDKYGVAILSGVLTKGECDSMKSGMWDYLEKVSEKFTKPIKRDEPDSWKELKQLWPKHSMLIQQWSIGHAQFIWDLRQNPNVLDVFAKLWSTTPDNLLTSFDGASFHMPPETTGSGWFRGKSWLHTDQSYHRNGFECIQSWITAYDVNAGDATLTFLEGSHKFHSKFQDRFHIETKDDWCLMETPEQLEFYTKENGCPQKYIKCPAGSMVLWDSRTIHCGQEASKLRPIPNQRCVAYICMTPRTLATPAVLKKKIKAFEELRSCNHWPHKPKVFPKAPRTFGQQIAEITQIEAPTIGPIGRRLVGYDN